MPGALGEFGECWRCNRHSLSFPEHQESSRLVQEVAAQLMGRGIDVPLWRAKTGGKPLGSGNLQLLAPAGQPCGASLAHCLMVGPSPRHLCHCDHSSHPQAAHALLFPSPCLHLPAGSSGQYTEKTQLSKDIRGARPCVKQPVSRPPHAPGGEGCSPQLPPVPQEPLHPDLSAAQVQQSASQVTPKNTNCPSCCHPLGSP